MNRITSIFLISLLVSAVALAQYAPPTVIQPTYADISQDLYSIVMNSPQNPVAPPSVVVQKHGPGIEDLGGVTGGRNIPTLAPVIQTTAGPPFQGVIGENFLGLGTGFPSYSIFVAPPDTTMAVGPSHVVQWVNIHYAVFDKTGTPLLPAPGFAAGNTIWAGFGGLCETTNRGDVLVAYDRAADRWVFSQFAFNVLSGNPAPPFLQCFAVSTTGDPLGSYARYSYTFTNFNDYGKLGVWPDAYYMAYNMFDPPAFPNNGAMPCAYNRAKMLVGDLTAETICFPEATYAGGNFGFLPSDLEGSTAPPGGTPNFFMRYSTAQVLRYIKFHVDFVTPANSTFNDGFGGATGTFIELNVAPTARSCNNAGQSACIPQPAPGELLQTLGDRLMYRLAYRNRGGTESLLVTHAVDPDGAAGTQAQVRWYEVRSPSAATPTLFQNSTFFPDATNRWMSSAAMDKQGNIMMGYSVSSAAVNPGIRMTGRLRSDLRNRMQQETTIVNGTGVQSSNTFNRWGDYSTMQVDPSDDCTFWYSTEYYVTTGSFNWSTRIASAKFPGCQ